MTNAKLKMREPKQQAIVERSVTSLIPYTGNARTHSKKQIAQIAASIKRLDL